MKVFARLFQKAAQVEGAKPSSPPQRRNFPNGVSFGTFLCASGVKEKYGNSLLT